MPVTVDLSWAGGVRSPSRHRATLVTPEVIANHQPPRQRSIIGTPAGLDEQLGSRRAIRRQRCFILAAQPTVLFQNELIDRPSVDGDTYRLPSPSGTAQLDLEDAGIGHSEQQDPPERPSIGSPGPVDLARRQESPRGTHQDARLDRCRHDANPQLAGVQARAPGYRSRDKGLVHQDLDDERVRAAHELSAQRHGACGDGARRDEAVNRLIAYPYGDGLRRVKHVRPALHREMQERVGSRISEAHCRVVQGPSPGLSLVRLARVEAGQVVGIPGRFGFG